MLRSAIVIFAVAGCSPPPHAIVEVLDPDGLAADAVALEFGEADSTMREISLTGKSFPVSFATTASRSGTRAIWVNALDSLGRKLARGYSEVELRADKTTPTEIVLTPACETAPGHSKCLLADGMRTGECLDGECFGALWSRVYDEGPQSDVPMMVRLDTDGNIVLSGVTAVDPTLSQFAQCWLAKMNRQGEFLWSRTWGQPDRFSAAADLGFDDAGDIYVAGMLDWDTGGEGSVGQITKWDPDGTQLWSLEIAFEPVELSDTASGIAVAGDGSFAVTGTANIDVPVVIQSTNHGDIWVRKYNADRSVAWTVTHDDEANMTDGAAGITFTGDGDVLVAGIVTRFNSGLDIMLRRMSGADGSEIWTTYYDGPASGNDAIWRVARDDDDNAYLVGWENEYTPSVTGVDMFLHKYDPSGALVWARTYDGRISGDDNGMGVAIDREGNVVAVGIESTGPASSGIWIGKLSADGDWLWHLTEDNGFGRAITTDPTNGNIIAVGGAVVSGQDANVWVAEYGP